MRFLDFRVLLATAALAILTPAAGAAQIVEGYLLAGGTGASVVDGTLRLHTPRGMTVAEAESDEEGFFRIVVPQRGTYFLTASADGFADLTHGHFDVRPGQTHTWDIYMRPEPISLEGIEVDTRIPLAFRVDEVRLGMFGYPERAKSGLGWFIGPDVIDKKKAANVSDLMRMVPRMDMGQGFGTRLRMDCGEYVGIVDNITLFAGQGWDIDFAVSPTDIAAIEIYTSLAELPVEFRRGRNCGAVVIWTKG